MHIKCENINDALYTVATTLLKQGKEVIVNRKDVTDNRTYELSPCLLEIEHPNERILLYNGRRENPFAQLYETLWVLSGSDEIEHLKFFIPRASDFSDDGNVWRAAYGKRLREAGVSKTDQIKYVIKTLNGDRGSRRAVMTIWNPDLECTIEHSKDYPCSDFVQFLIRNGKLDCHILLRSNDLMWGCSNINVFEWTYLQEMIANELDVGVGRYFHYTPSMHMYDKFVHRVTECVEGHQHFELSSGLPKFPVYPSLEQGALCSFVSRINHIIGMREEDVRTLADYILERYEKIGNDHYVYIFMYVLYKKIGKELFTYYLDHFMRKVPLTDMKVAVKHYFNRQYGLSKDVGKAHKECTANSL